MTDKPKYWERLWNKSAMIVAIRAASVLASFYIIVYYARHLSVADNGTYLSFFVQLSIITGIGAIGIQSVVFNFNRASFIQYIRNVPVWKWIAYLLFILAVSLTSYFLINKSFSIESIVVVLFACSIISLVLDSVLLVISKHIFQLLLNIGYGIGLVYIHILVLHTDVIFHLNDLIWLWTMLLGTKVLIQLILASIAMKETSTHEVIQYPKRSTWWLLGIYETFQLVVRQADKAIFFIIFPKEIGAAYFNGRIDIPLLPAVLSSVRTAALLSLSKSLDNRQSIETIRETMSILATIALGVFFFGAVYASEIFEVFFTSKYNTSVPFFLISLCLIPIQFCISLVFILQFKEKIKAINFGAVLDLIISIVLSIVLFPLLKVYAIITAIVISTAVQSVYYLWVAGRSVNMPIYKLLPLKYYSRLLLVYGSCAWISHYISYQILNLSSEMVLLVGSIVGLSAVMIIFVNRKNKIKVTT